MAMRISKRLLVFLTAAVFLLAVSFALAEEETEPVDPIQTEPLPEPEPTADANLTLSLSGGTPDDSGVWHHSLNPEGSLTFTWVQEGAADSWLAVVSGPDGEAGRATVTSPSYTLPQADLAEATYTLNVTAYLNGSPVCNAALTFVLGTNSGGQGGQGGQGGPGGGGGKPNGGRTQRPGQGGAGSGITPGKALTSSHARGTGDLLPYGAVRLELPEGEMDVLTLGGETLDLTCGGAAFTAALEEDTLLLSSEASDWTFTQATLNTLSLSGVRVLSLSDGEETVSLDTDLAMTGTDYARERSDGFASSDFRFSLTDEGFTVTVEDRVYRLQDDKLEDMG